MESATSNIHNFTWPSIPLSPPEIWSLIQQSQIFQCWASTPWSIGCPTHQTLKRFGASSHESIVYSILGLVYMCVRHWHPNLYTLRYWMLGLNRKPWDSTTWAEMCPYSSLQELLHWQSTLGKKKQKFPLQLHSPHHKHLTTIRWIQLQHQSIAVIYQIAKIQQALLC